MSRRNAFRGWLPAVVAAFLCIAYTTDLRAQPEINKIETKARPGQEIELTLRGKGLLEILRVDRVRIGVMDAKVLHSSVESDSLLRIRIRIPQDAEKGYYKIRILASGDTFSGWLAPVSARRPAVRAPEIEVTADGTAIPDGGRSAVELGSTVVGSPLQKKFGITNTGSAPLILGRPKLPAGFGLLGSFPDTIAAGGSEEFSVQLEADSAGRFAGRLEFANNDSDESPFDFELVGVVEPLPVPDIAEAATPVQVPKIVVSLGPARPIRAGQAEAIDFDTTTVGESVEKTFEIRNSGTAPLTLSDLVLPSGFRLVGGFPGRIEAGGSANFVVQLEATSEATFAGTLQFDTNVGGGRRFAFPIRGNVRSVPPAPPSPLARWWIVAPVVVGGLGAAFGTRYLLRKMRMKVGPKSAVPAAAPLFQFNPKKDLGSQRMAEREPMRVDARLRVKSVLDPGRQEIRVEGPLVVEENVTVVDQTQAPPGADDLKRIEGIGPKISALLRSAGIHTFAQLAAADVEALRTLLADAGISIADPATWPQQSKMAAAGDWQALEELQSELKGGRVVHRES